MIMKKSAFMLFIILLSLTANAQTPYRNEDGKKIDKEELETKKRAKKQYQSMKSRIQFLYENGSESLWMSLLNAESMSDFINRAEYVKAISSYDREKLEEYEQMCAKIASEKAKLEEEEKSLQALEQKTKENISKSEQEIGETQSLSAEYEAEIEKQKAYEAQLEAQKAKEDAEKCGMYYVNQRWLGGTLTNFKTIRNRIKRLTDIEKMQEDGTFEVLPKKEVILLKKEMEKLEKNLGGIKEMTEIPGVMFVVDPNKEKIAILEARKLGIPVIGLVDTNCNPEDVDYAIPGNDDAIRAVKLIMDVMANAVIEGRQGESMEQEVDEQEQMAEDAKPESIEEVVAAEAEENK